MGSLRALQEWCRLQCEHYDDVEIKDMSTSFRDGLAFFVVFSHSKSYGNMLSHAFEVAETQLGIPALLDPEDMVSMKVPDRLSIITYVSQYYNFFNNKSQANPPCMKRPSPVGHTEPAQKRPLTPLGDREAESEAKRSAISSTCAACQKHVHLVQRFLVDGKLYHRNCFRCSQCHSTLLPGSYRLGHDTGTFVCSHHLARQALANQNGRPDLSKKPEVVHSARLDRSPDPHSSSSVSVQGEALSSGDQTKTTDVLSRDSSTVSPVITNSTDTTEQSKELDQSGPVEETPCSSSPPNPFDDSDEEDEEEEEGGEGGKEDETQTPAKPTTNEDHPSTPVSQTEDTSRPVPAPRRVSEPTPPPRPCLCLLSLLLFVYPPWLALVQSESKKKKAPAPPPPGLATPNAGSLSSLKGDGSRPSTPPPPSNPFEDDDDETCEVEEEEAGEGGETITATHPWYSITRATETSGADTPTSGGSSSRSASPGSTRSKKRPAPRAPLPPAVLPHSVPSSCSPSPALSIESLSSGSDHSSSHPPHGGSTGSEQEHIFTKSVSEPSISSPGDSTALPPSSSNEHLLHPPLSPPSVPSSASSAPATPQTSRSSGTKGTATPSPRPQTSPSPLAVAAAQICKENPFNRKASPSPSKSKTKPPKGSRPARPPAPGHGFPLIKRKVQSDQFIPVEDIHGEMSQLEKQLDDMEQRGVELEKKLRDCPNDEDEEHLLVDWFTLIHEKHLLVRREAELVYTAKQQNLEERQADVEYELRCLLNKPEKDWTEEDKNREQELMAELVTIIEQRNQIVNNMDQDRQREEEEDKLMEAMLKKKDSSEQHRKKGAKFKPIKVLKRLSHKGEPGHSRSSSREKS
uniref:MICAL-like 1a n=1 Tax=Cynoglossus semilaevis TaxID=244447 RepID=A0A3P8VTG9_CYNSE